MTNSGPSISVVIPLYNKRDYIERTLRSVRAQTFTDYQIIVVNDGSTDGGEELVKPFLQDGDKLINQENAGHAAARNRGMAEADADLFASLDADDEWLPNHLACINELSERFPETGMFSPGYRQYGGRIVRDVYLAGTKPQIVDFFRVSIGVPVLHSTSVAIRREVFEQLGGFLLNEPVSADREYWARIALHWPVALHPEVTNIYHKDASGKDKLRKGRKGLTGQHLIFGMLEEALEDDNVPEEIKADVRAYAVAERVSQARFLIYRGRAGEAREIINGGCADPAAHRSVRMLQIYTTLAGRLHDGSQTSIFLGKVFRVLKTSPGRVIRMALGIPRQQGEIIIWERLRRAANND